MWEWNMGIMELICDILGWSLGSRSGVCLRQIVSGSAAVGHWDALLLLHMEWTKAPSTPPVEKLANLFHVQIDKDGNYGGEDDERRDGDDDEQHLAQMPLSSDRPSSLLPSPRRLFLQIPKLALVLQLMLRVDIICLCPFSAERKVCRLVY